MVLSIAGIGIKLHIPWKLYVNLAAALKCFEEEESDRILCEIIVINSHDSQICKEWYESPVVEQTENVLGKIEMRRVGPNWIFTLSDDTVMICSGDFYESAIYISPSYYSGPAISTLIHIVWCQVLVYRGIGFGCHASCVSLANKGYLFLGPSGYGKSTQSRLWQSTLGASLVNDDNPVVILGNDGKLLVGGTPWSGKTPCYRQVIYEIGGIFRLCRSCNNEATLLRDEAGFMALLPSCSCIRSDSGMQARLYRIVAEAVRRINIFRLECRPDREAVLEAFSSISANTVKADVSRLSD